MTVLLRLCLLAYPRSVRRRDGDHLIDLASELAARSGVWREALSLLRGGVAERLCAARAVPVAVTAVVVAVVLAAGGAAVADGVDERVESRSCSDECTDVRAWAEAQERQGWSCERTTSRADEEWACTAP